ncbi:MAG: hypothetical protein FWJ62_06940 [Thermaerobacter sp.]|nr:hypothetical protein [Bacillota bacterium]
MPQKKRFLLRLDPAIYDAVQRWADDEWRSVNAQIEYLLRDALRRAGRLPARSPAGADAAGPGRPPGGDEQGQERESAGP